MSSGVLDAHSVVCDREGILWDITFPDLAEHGILFIRHTGCDEEFTEIRHARAQHICPCLAGYGPVESMSAWSAPDASLLLPEDDLHD